MITLHDLATRAALRARIASLRPDAPPRWGRMSADQMLWHLGTGLELALGERSAAPRRPPLPRPIMRFLVINVPWPRGAPTLPEIEARSPHDFEVERARCLALLDRVAARPIDGAWPTHAALGAMTGAQWSALMAKHLAHHLTRFGA